MDVIRKRRLDVTHARAKPAPLNQAVRRAVTQVDSQREWEILPKSRSNS
jgi:hypothetical protein